MRGRNKEETRRSARVATTFLVGIAGLDDEPVPRKGDISATGIYFETDKAVGAVGSVQTLTVLASNRQREIHVMAHLVRSVTFDDVRGRTIYGVAFEFMPASEEAALALEELVQYVLLVVDDADVGAAGPKLSPRLHALALAEARSDEDAFIKQLSVRHMTLETSWGVAPGERLRVEIAAPGMSRRVRLEGNAIRVTPLGKDDGKPPYEIEVEFQTEIERPPRTSHSSMTFAAVRPELQKAMVAPKAPEPRLPALGSAEDDDEVSNVLDELFSSLIHAPAEAKPKRDHLSGLISRIRLPTLCALFDMERLTGELRLRSPRDEAVLIYVRNGQMIDIDPLQPGMTPRAQIGRVLGWEEGTFEFAVLPIERPDILGVSTTALLLDLAREADEANAGIQKNG